LRLLLNVPGSHAGGHTWADGMLPTPGRTNLMLIQVTDLDATVEFLRRPGIHFGDHRLSRVAVRQVSLADLVRLSDRTVRARCRVPITNERGRLVQGGQRDD